jgi:hypothetical protein
VRDFDASLQGEPNVAFNWFARAVARAALGDSAGAAADLARASASGCKQCPYSFRPR